MYSVLYHCCGKIAKIKNSEFLCIVLDVVSIILQKKKNTENSKILNIFSMSRSSGIFLSKKKKNVSRRRNFKGFDSQKIG